MRARRSHFEDTTTTDHTGGVEAIRRVIADAQAGFNDNDAELRVEHFAECLDCCCVWRADRRLGRVTPGEPRWPGLVRCETNAPATHPPAGDASRLT